MGAYYRYRTKNQEEFRDQFESDLPVIKEGSLSDCLDLGWEKTLLQDRDISSGGWDIMIEEDHMPDCPIKVSRDTKGVVCPGYNGPRIEGSIEARDFCEFYLTLWPVVDLQKSSNASSHELYGPNGEYVFEIRQKFPDRDGFGSLGNSNCFYYGNDILTLKLQMEKFRRDISQHMRSRKRALNHLLNKIED